MKKNESKRTHKVNSLGKDQTFTTQDFYELENRSGINDWAGKIAFDYIPLPDHYIRFGAGATHHTFNPGRVFLSDTTGNRNYGASKCYAWEYGAYAEYDIRLTKRLKTNVGLHWSAYSIGERFYSIFQPRISTRYLITPHLSAKASYARMAQYIHLLPNSYGGFPRDFWVPATELLRPQRADQIALGLAHNYMEDYEISIEGYYKTLNDVTDYKDGATGLLNIDESWEQRILQGTGTSYGMELFVQKKTGNFTGWAGYMLSWTDRHFDELNDGKPFPYKYDRRHDVSITFMQRFERLNKRNRIKKYDFSATWVFGSGYCVTLPVGIVDVSHPIIRETNSAYTSQYQLFSERNGYRVNPYHRLDLSMSFIKQVKRGEFRWVVSVYNAYIRKNPYYVTAEQDRHGKFKLMQYSLFPILPSISYQFKF